MDSLYHFIQNTMEKIGYNSFSIHAVTVEISKTEQRIEAQNQYFFLMNDSLQSGTILQSDHEVLHVNEYNTILFGAYLKAFSGTILIEQAIDTIQSLHFLKVIPD